MSESLSAWPVGYLGLGAAAAVGVASAVYLLSKPICLDLGIDYSNQSIILEDGSYADPWTVEHGKLMEYFYDDARTLYESFLRGKRLAGDGRCLGTRTGSNKEFQWLGYNEVHKRMQAFGSGLFQLGLLPGQKTLLGIFAQNCAEWVITDQMCQMFSMVTVALYDNLGVKSVVHIIDICEISTIVCDTVSRAELLIDNSSLMASLKIIVMIENTLVTEELQQKAKAAGLRLVYFAEVESLGEKDLHEPVAPKPSDIATVCFTSGTTGDPKGVVLTHGNLIADIAAVVQRLSILQGFQQDNSHLSYLPLAHMYERMNVTLMITHGAKIGFYSRDIQLLLDDLQALKPSSFPTVPRLLYKIRDKVLSSVEGSRVKSFLLQHALNRKLKEVRRGIIRKNSFWDKLIFRKVQALLGGEVLYICTGSAPLSEEVFDFVRCVFGCLMFEGYGQTEGSAGITLHNPGDPTAGHVGSPLPCNYVKLIDVPEMKYFVKDGIGEICVKGTNVMSGYYRNPEKTKEAFTHDGWLRTGDVGIFNKNGTLQIIDRCKHIFKLQQGEYVAPERIEAIYSRSKYIQQCFVDGDSLKSHCVAVVVPDLDFVLPWAANNGKVQDLKALCQDETLKEIILADMLDTGKKAQLKGFEQVLDICLVPEPFSLTEGLVTPTFKNKRAQLRRYFAHKVAAIYAKHKGSL